MKPVNLNQLLFHPKEPTLSFFCPPLKGQTEGSNLDEFLNDIQSQLLLQGREALCNIVEKNNGAIKKILKSHPEKSHGFFISESLQGYMALENFIEPYCTMGNTFHVRPLLEELFVNPEYLVVNVSLYDIKIYRGDFHHVEILQQYEFDQLPMGLVPMNSSHIFTPTHLGLIPYKTILAIKNIAQKVIDLSLYNSLPVIVTGLDEMKNIFLRYLASLNGVISHFHDDFYEKTCVEILEKCRLFRSSILDYYSARLKDRLKQFIKSKRLISDMGEIIKAAALGKIIQLIIPNESKVWGTINFETYEYEIHKKIQIQNPSIDILNELAEEVIKQDGQILFLGLHFFPKDAHVLAVLKG